MKKLLQTELRVAFHKQSQRLGVRISKYLLLAVFIFFFWNTSFFWWTLAGLGVGGLLLHGFYRYKTRGWTQSYGEGLLRWDYDRVMTKRKGRLSSSR